MGKSILELRNINKSFPGVHVLTDVNLSIREGEILALIGENGAGKSTLMKIISGIIPDYNGELILDGRSVHFLHPLDAQEAGIALIHQELSVIDELSVAENIFLGRESNLFGFISYKEMNQSAKALLDSMDLKINVTKSASELKVGQKQLIEIAKALSLNARIVIMDEPTSALSDHETQKLFTIIKKLKAQGTSVIFISHRLQEVMTISDRIVVLRDGFMVSEYATENATKEQIIRDMVGRQVKEIFKRVSPKPGKEVLQVEHLFSFHPHTQKQLVKDVSFNLREGEILGITGLMGAGRTELLETLFGLYPNTSQGFICLKGKEVSIDSPKAAIANGIALVNEDRKKYGLVLSLGVRENATLATLDHSIKLGFIDDIDERNRTNQYVQKLNIKTPHIEQLVNRLSGGNQQKIVLAKWLLTNPKILLLDEPTRGIDVGARQEIYELIDQLTHEGISIILVSSDLPEVMSLADRILVMCENRMTGEIQKNEMDEEKIMTLATQFEQRSAVG